LPDFLEVRNGHLNLPLLDQTSLKLPLDVIQINVTLLYQLGDSLLLVKLQFLNARRSSRRELSEGLVRFLTAESCSAGQFYLDWSLYAGRRLRLLQRSLLRSNSIGNASKKTFDFSYS
jgi:hypothetical protein